MHGMRRSYGGMWNLSLLQSTEPAILCHILVGHSMAALLKPSSLSLFLSLEAKRRPNFLHAIRPFLFGFWAPSAKDYSGSAFRPKHYLARLPASQSKWDGPFLKIHVYEIPKMTGAFLKQTNTKGKIPQPGGIVLGRCGSRRMSYSGENVVAHFSCLWCEKKPLWKYYQILHVLHEKRVFTRISRILHGHSYIFVAAPIHACLPSESAEFMLAGSTPNIKPKIKWGPKTLNHR